MTTLALHPSPHITDIVRAVNETINGNLNNVGSVTLTANAATTVVTDRLVSTASHIGLTATTANAAAEVGSGTIYVTTANGSFTITHANNAQTDRVFTYARFGG